MSRPPTILAEKKLRIVLSVLQGEITIAEAARREKVSEQAIGNWKRPTAMASLRPVITTSAAVNTPILQKNAT